jgi:signal transduction histidine kinase
MNFGQYLILALYALSLMLLISLLAIILGGTRQKSRHFIALVVTLTAWFLPQFIAQYVLKGDVISVALIRLSFIFAGAVPFVLDGFITEILALKRHTASSVIWLVALVLGVVCAATQPGTINVHVSYQGIAVTSDQPFYYALIGCVFLGFLIAIINIRAQEQRQKRRQMNTLALRTLRQALTLALVLNLVGAVFLAKYEWSQILTPVSMAAFAVITYVAIFRHKLFDVRAFFARSMGYILSLVAFATLYGLLVFLAAQWLFGVRLGLGADIFFASGSAIMSLAFHPFRTKFDKATNRLFYQDAYDPQDLFDKLNQLLVSSLDLKYLMEFSSKILAFYLKPELCLIGLKSGQTRHRIFGAPGHAFNNADIRKVRELTPKIRRNVIIADELDEGHKVLREIMKSNNIAVLVRLTQNVRRPEEGLGYIVLGPKKSGNMYTQQDVRTLEAVANELILAIQNALHFEEIQKFNELLQARVDDATKKLRNTNEKLKALDETKDDFISMASHQLRTPLTSVKGYLSMVLEGDAGEINETQKKMLGQAFTSSQRMVYLIADLLNVSRLRTGKFIIESAPVNLADMVSEEIEQLVETAAARAIGLTYHKPASFPELMLDETKTRQVVMNFVDNAIYYTPSGGQIKVVLEETPTSVELKVVDNGIGVPKAEQHHLFTKFYRAGNAQKARPDGTGLGLFMAKKVILAQGGSILFESKEGKGSTFGFLFPKTKLHVTQQLPVKTAVPVE